MLLHLPIVVMATLSPVIVSDTVPNFDVVRECRNENGSILESGRCSKDEGTALRELQQTWPQFKAADKRNCTSEATAIGGFASYVELLTCLEMTGDAKQTDNNPLGSETKDTMPPHAQE